MKSKIDILHIDPRELRPNPWNSNYVAPENEAKLKESIRRFGVYKPIICRTVDDRLEILGGEHRARAAAEMGIETVPVVDLGAVSDKKAKEIGLADNGRYGDDDLLKLSKLLTEIGGEDAATFLPFDEKDLASIFAISKIDIDDLELPGEKPTEFEPLPDARATLTHQFLRFKVPLADAEAVSQLIEMVIKAKGYDKEKDSLAAAGMALVDIANSARENL